MGVVKNLMVRVGVDLTEFEEKFKKAQTSLKNAGDKMNSIGKTMTTNVTVPIIAAGTALGALAVKAGQTADELITMSNQTGMSTDTLQGLEYAARFVDVELETMTKGMAKTVSAMREATTSGQSYIDVAGGLQLSMYNANGEMLTSEEMFYRAIDAISGLSSATEQEIAAQDLFGRSYQELMPLMEAGAEGLRNLTKEAEELGLVMSEEDLKAMGEFDDAMQKLQAQFKVLGLQIVKEFQPALKKLVPFIQETVVPAVKNFAEKVADIVQGFMNLDPFWQKVIVALITIIALIGPLLMLIGAVSGAMKGMAIVAAVLTSTVGLIAAAVIIAVAAFAYLFNTSEPFRNFCLSIATYIQDFIVGQVNDAINALNALIAVANLVPGIDIKPFEAWEPKQLFPESSSAEDIAKWKEEHSEGWSADSEQAATQQKNMMDLFGQLSSLLGGQMDVSQQVTHSGEVTVKGVNDMNELVGIADIIFEDLMAKYAAEARG